MPSLHDLRQWLGGGLARLAARIAPPAPSPPPSSPPLPQHPQQRQQPWLSQQQPAARTDLVKPASPARQEPNPAGLPLAHPVAPGGLPPIVFASPANREPLSVEQAVLGRTMALLKREASDSLAALGAAHALITSARLSQVQHLREQVERGTVPLEALGALAADYQGWQNDQVRLFDALGLVLRMAVPGGMALEQINPHLHEQARAHLASLSAEYQRGLLNDQFRPSPSAPESGGP